jgi:NAD(P)-dependent dehydrogenase (short-subunit alcohol dehydrogenase family)
MGRLQDKVAIITGSATGIGEAIAKKFAHEGAKVIVNSLPGDPVDDVVANIREHGREAVGYVGDVSEPEHAQSCVQVALDAFGKLDVLVNNAGVYQEMNEADDFTIEGFDYMVKMNVRSAFLMTKYAIPHLQKTRGNVIFTGSEAGTIGQPGCIPYGGTKGFNIQMARGLALEQAPYGVRSNAVCPGATETSWHNPKHSGMTPEAEKTIQSAIPMGRHATTEEVANVFAFVASDEASFVTGALYFVDGGVSIARGAVGEDVPKKLRKQPEGILDIEHDKTPSAGNKVKL